MPAVEVARKRKLSEWGVTGNTPNDKVVPATIAPSHTPRAAAEKPRPCARGVGALQDLRLATGGTSCASLAGRSMTAPICGESTPALGYGLIALAGWVKVPSLRRRLRCIACGARPEVVRAGGVYGGGSDSATEPQCAQAALMAGFEPAWRSVRASILRRGESSGRPPSAQLFDLFLHPTDANSLLWQHSRRS